MECTISASKWLAAMATGQAVEYANFVPEGSQVTILVLQGIVFSVLHAVASLEGLEVIEQVSFSWQ